MFARLPTGPNVRSPRAVCTPSAVSAVQRVGCCSRCAHPQRQAHTLCCRRVGVCGYRKGCTHPVLQNWAQCRCVSDSGAATCVHTPSAKRTPSTTGRYGCAVTSRGAHTRCCKIGRSAAARPMLALQPVCTPSASSAHPLLPAGEGVRSPEPVYTPPAASARSAHRSDDVTVPSHPDTSSTASGAATAVAWSYPRSSSYSAPAISDAVRRVSSIRWMSREPT